jgi:hypothetical protein
MKWAYHDYDPGDQEEDGSSPFYTRELTFRHLYNMIFDGSSKWLDEALVYPVNGGTCQVKCLTDWSKRAGGGFKIVEYERFGSADREILEEIEWWAENKPGKLSIWHEATVNSLDNHVWDEAALVFWVNDEHLAAEFALRFRGRFASAATEMVGPACEPPDDRQLELL